MQKKRKSYYPDGQLESIGTLDEKGRANGGWKRYYPNGKLWRTEIYSNGKRIRATSRVYHQLSPFDAQLNIIANLFYGEPDGQLEAIGTLDEKNRPDGKWKRYAPNGKLMLTEFYYKGKLIKSKKPFTIFPPPKGTIIAIIGIGLSRLFGNWILLTISIYFIIEVLYTLKERKQAKEKYLFYREDFYLLFWSVILLFFFLINFFLI